MAAITPTIITEVGPNLATKVWIYQFTKSAQNDYLTCSGEFRTVDGAVVVVDNALESHTISSYTITFTSASTATGYALVIGRN